MSTSIPKSTSIEINSETAAACESDALTASKTSSNVSESVQLDIDALIQGFAECLKEDTLIMDGYLRAYTEMTKFFEVLGTVFTFVTSDVYSKLNILRCYRKGGSADYYHSVHSMLEYEKDQPDLTQPSASRTLLRLHRALAFVSGFLREIATMEMDTKLGPMAGPIYTRTLAPHHGWFISKTVGAVIMLLPTKKVILTKLVGDDVAKQRHIETSAPELCRLMDKVYDATQAFYADYDMLNLP